MVHLFIRRVRVQAKSDRDNVYIEIWVISQTNLARSEWKSYKIAKARDVWKKLALSKLSVDPNRIQKGAACFR